MITILFPAEWALRSSILILIGALLLRVLRVKDPAIRLAAWTVMLFGSLAIPALSVALPEVPVMVMRAATRPPETPAVLNQATPSQTAARPPDFSARGDTGISRRFDWARATLTIYVVVAIVLLLRLCVGLAMSLRLLRNSQLTDRAMEGIEVRESDRVTAPVTLGVARPAIVLPGDWRQWDGAKLEAVLAHERSHILRLDPALQLLSAIHRAVLWHSPMSWFLHKRIVRTAEEASDDAAVAVTRDRARYAEMLLDFMRRGVRGADSCGVPMARYGRPDERIQRILDGTTLSRGVTRWNAAAILVMGSPIAWLVAAAHPQNLPQAPATVAARPVQATATTPAVQATANEPRRGAGYLAALGSAAAYTVTVKSRVDGELLSVNFKEGDLVRQGQLLASIDPRPFRILLTEAEGQVDEDMAQLDTAKQAEAAMRYSQTGTIARLEARIKTDRAKVDNAKLLLNYTQIVSPITGVAGLLLVDPGNIIHATDATGIVIINQVQPIAVLFNIIEDGLPQVLARIRAGASLPVEAWNRENTVKLATGRSTAVDNQIDATTGTAKLKAVFENKDGALFPNQFVNVRLMVGTR